MNFVSAPSTSAKNDELLLVVASSAALAAAGLDLRLIDAVPCSLSSRGGASSADTGTPFKIKIGRLRTAGVESMDDVRSQMSNMKHAVTTISQMSLEEIALAVEQLQPAVGNQDQDRAAHEYGEFGAREVANHMRCSPKIVYEREATGDLFAVLAPARINGRRYPAFQLSENLNRPLLKQIIQEYRDAGASTTLLWGFLRRPQKEFGGQTAVDMLLGASAPAYDGLLPRERFKAIMDVVGEELSRVTR